MEFIFELLLQFVGEFLLQVVFELVAELGFHSLADTFKRPKNPFLSTIGFLIWGAIAGGLSLWVVSKSPISNPDLRRINILLTPLAAGVSMMLIGKLRDRKGQDLVRLDRFGYAFVFAFSMAIVRYIWAK